MINKWHEILREGVELRMRVVLPESYCLELQRTQERVYAGDLKVRKEIFLFFIFYFFNSTIYLCVCVFCTYFYIVIQF